MKIKRINLYLARCFWRQCFLRQYFCYKAIVFFTSVGKAVREIAVTECVAMPGLRLGDGTINVRMRCRRQIRENATASASAATRLENQSPRWAFNTADGDARAIYNCRSAWFCMHRELASCGRQIFCRDCTLSGWRDLPAAILPGGHVCNQSSCPPGYCAGDGVGLPRV